MLYIAVASVAVGRRLGGLWLAVAVGRRLRGPWPAIGVSIMARTLCLSLHVPWIVINTRIAALSLLRCAHHASRSVSPIAGPMIAGLRAGATECPCSAAAFNSMPCLFDQLAVEFYVVSQRGCVGPERIRA